LSPALADAFGDSLPERNHSPGYCPSRAPVVTPAALPRAHLRRLLPRS
jgi:hypothetical protein